MSCQDDILKAIEEKKLPPMSKAEAENLIGEIDRIREFVGERDGIAGEAFRKEVANYLEQKRFARVAQAREAKENLLKFQANMDFIKQPAFDGAPEKAFRGKLLGAEGRYSQGGSRGAAVIAESLHASRSSGLYSKLQEHGFLEIAEKGLIDKDVAQEMYLIDHGRAGETKDAQAVEIAKILRAATDSILADKQAAGSAVRKAKGYVAKTTHDRTKLFEATFDAWKEDVLKNLDRQKTFGALSDERVNEEIEGIYRHILAGEPAAGVTEANGKNLSKSQSLARTFIFKDGYSWFDYNSKYGKGNLLETVLTESRKAAHQTAMMDAFGTNPEAGYKRAISETEKALSGENLKRFMGQRKDLDAAFARAMGFSDTHGTELVARVGWLARLVQSVAKTGTAALSTMTDLAFSASRITSQTGENNIFSEAGSQITTFLDGIKDQEKRLTVASKLGVHLDNFQSQLLDKFGVETAKPGWIASAAQRFQKLNLMKYVDQAAAFTGAVHHSSALAEHAGTPFEALDERLRLGLEKYNFDEKSWALASLGVEEVKGMKLMTPESVRALPDEAVRAIYPEGDPNKIRFTVANHLLSIYGDTSAASASRSSPRVQHILLGSSLDDGSWGTFQRLLVQFKQPIVMNMLTAGETLLSNPAAKPRTVGSALAGKGDFYGFSGLLILSSILGYAKIVAKEAASGKTAPDPRNPEIALQSFLNGGAAGLYGDFLFKELHRNYGTSAAELAMGPVLTESWEILDMGRKALQGETTWKDVWKKTWDNTPGHNLFYAKAALDYLISNNINEMLNPGYKRKLARRLREQPGLFGHNQEYFMFQPTR